MYQWITSENRKVHQRYFNHTMRLLNRNIANDNLWRGRFVVRQVGGQWINYEGSKSHYYWVELLLIDKKTGLFELIADEDNSLMFSATMWFKMNNFITDKVKVWENEGREALYEKDKEDYTKHTLTVKGTWNPIVTINKPNGETIVGKRIY